MAIAMKKLNTTESFRTKELFLAPAGAIARGHTAPIFRRLHR